jgi:hypothetical protein
MRPAEAELVARVRAYPGTLTRRFAIGAPRGAVRVLAYGSNASPEVLARKLGHDAGVTCEPLDLPGWEAVYSAHVSPWGGLPATVVPAPGVVLEAAVLTLDETAFAALRATEPNYEVEAIGGLRAFVSRHGPLGGPVAVAAVPARGRTLAALTEAEVLERVRARVAPRLGPDAFVLRLATDAGFRREVGTAL